MNNNNVERERKSGGIFLYAIIIITAIIQFLLSAIICFAPAFVMSAIFKLVDNRMKGVQVVKKQENWVLFWSTICQITMYSAGWLTFKKVAFVKGSFTLTGSFTRISNFNTWDTFYYMMMFLAIPCLAFYLIKVSDYFRDSECEEPVYYIENKKNLIRMFLITTIGYPLAFVYYGARANKISWLFSGLVYLAGPFTGFAILGKFHLGAPFIGATTGFAAIMWIIAMIHTYRIRNEYLEKTGQSTGVYVVESNRKVA